MGPERASMVVRKQKVRRLCPIVSHQHLLLPLNEDRITDLHSGIRSGDWRGGYSERGIAF